MSKEKPQTENKHPEEWKRDLNPDSMAGQNLGTFGQHPEKSSRTAYDIKEAHRRFQEFSDEELKQIRILPEGARLEEQATYLDLRHLDRGEFTATGNMQAGPDNWYVPKSEVHFTVWNKLRGILDTERTWEKPDNQES